MQHVVHVDHSQSDIVSVNRKSQSGSLRCLSFKFSSPCPQHLHTLFNVLFSEYLTLCLDIMSEGIGRKMIDLSRERFITGEIYRGEILFQTILRKEKSIVGRCLVETRYEEKMMVLFRVEFVSGL